jgi:hypothetical protein
MTHLLNTVPTKSEFWYFIRAYGKDSDHAVFLFGDGAWFHLSGYVNSHNRIYWSAENLMLIQEVSSHDIMGGVWRTVSVA